MNRSFFISFQAKVLAMVAIAMLGLMGTTIWIVNSHVTAQLEHDAAESLLTADSVFRNMQRVRARNLLLRFGNVPNEPRFKAVAKQDDAPTMRFLLQELAGQYEADAVLFTRPDLTPLADASRESLTALPDFAKATHELAHNALAGQPVYSTDHIHQHIYDLIAVPVIVSGETLGVLVFAVECGQAVAREFHQLTRCDVVMLAENRVTATTLPDTLLDAPSVHEMTAVLNDAGTLNVETVDQVTKLNLGDTHMMTVGYRFKSSTPGHVLGYLIVASYDSSLAALHATQRSLLLLGFVGVTVAMLVTWLLVRRITHPLRQLRDAAVAVGAGDFSQQVQVRTHDECGQLAETFNSMTRNLAGARDQLEQTVETLRSTRDRLTHSEKLSAIGEFVAGVTHELNNPLTSVIGFAELLQQTAPDERQRRKIDVIAREAHRCHKIVQSLLSFSRQHKSERKPINVNDVVDSAVDILQYQLRTGNVQIERRLSPQLPPVVADAHQLQQVFINLFNNARQAIEAHRPDGRIRIITRVVESQVEISIQDNGPGISPENMAKIFDPFFTTKEIGKGTGLGLSLCYGILHEHGGNITVQSKPGEGATFLLTLPVAPANGTLDQTVSLVLPVATPTGLGAGKRVLVVDDEESILYLTREILTGQRFEVDTAPDGETGLRKAREKQYDVILCDWKMPGLTGRQVFDELQRTHPLTAKRMVFMTGDVVSESTKEFLAANTRDCLAKPFAIDAFQAVIVKVLARARN